MAQYQVHRPMLKINNIQIEHITSFNFLGIILYENLKWEGHVNHFLNKMSKVIGTISKLKQNSHYNMGSRFGDIIMYIGYLEIKKTVRKITNGTYYAHSEQQFKLSDINKKNSRQEFKFIYKLLHNNLPHHFNSLTVTHNRDTCIHQYMMQRNDVLVPNIQHKFARKCVRNQMYVLLNNNPK